MRNRNVAIIGASNDRTKYGNQSVLAHQRNGYEVFPVNPRGGEIEGLQVFRSIREIDAPLFRVSLYVPPFVALSLLPQIAEKGCEELWLNPGTDTPEVIRAAKALELPVIIGCSIIDAESGA